MLVSLLIKQDLKILDVKFGIGTIKNVLNAQQDGFLPMEFVHQLIIYVKHGKLMENAKLAIKATSLKMENVNILNYKDLKILVAKHGTGMNKFVMNALIIGISKKAQGVFQLMINVKLLQKMELALPATKVTT